MTKSGENVIIDIPCFCIARYRFCHLRRLVFNQSSPVHPVSESRGGNLNVTNGERTKILVSNIGLIKIEGYLTGFVPNRFGLV